MKPAAPVTRIRTGPSYASPFVPFVVSMLLAELPGLVDFLAMALELLRAIEVRQRLVTASELGKCQPEVVLGVGLIGLARALEGGDRFPRDRLCARVVPGLEQARRLVGERHSVARRRRWR